MKTLLLLLAVCNAACLSTMGVADGLRASEHNIQALRGAPIDVDASELTILGDGSTPRAEVFAGAPNSEYAVSVRSQLAKSLGDLWNANPDAKDKARIKVAWGYDFTMKPMAVCLVLLTLFGCPIQKDEVAIDLTIQYRGNTWSGHGSATSWELFYRLGLLQKTMGEALGDALDDALSRPPR